MKKILLPAVFVSGVITLLLAFWYADKNSNNLDRIDNSSDESPGTGFEATSAQPSAQSEVRKSTAQAANAGDGAAALFLIEGLAGVCMHLVTEIHWNKQYRGYKQRVAWSLQMVPPINFGNHHTCPMLLGNFPYAIGSSQHQYNCQYGREIKITIDEWSICENNVIVKFSIDENARGTPNRGTESGHRGISSAAVTIAARSKTEASSHPSDATNISLGYPSVGVVSSDVLIRNWRVSEEDNGRLDPKALTPISGAYNPRRRLYLLHPASESWDQMRKAATRDGVILSVSSAYRTLTAQVQARSAYEAELEAWKANPRSKQNPEGAPKPAYRAVPGASEHGQGLALDFRNEAGRIRKKSIEFRWLTQNAKRFGWHPISNESWHWEFRGI